MGFFDLLKIKTKSKDNQKIEMEKQVLKDLARMSRESGDYYNAFYFDHKAHIDLFEQEISFQLVHAREMDDAGNAIQFMKQARAMMKSFRSWCEDQPGGREYYEKHIAMNPNMPNREARLDKQITDAEYIYYTVVPGILERAREDGGAKQADLCHAFNVGRDQVLFEIRRLEMAGQVRTEKRGKYVYIIEK